MNKVSISTIPPVSGIGFLCFLCFLCFFSDFIAEAGFAAKPCLDEAAEGAFGAEVFTADLLFCCFIIMDKGMSSSSDDDVSMYFRFLDIILGQSRIEYRERTKRPEPRKDSESSATGCAPLRVCVVCGGGNKFECGDTVSKSKI